jgi:hypothetical protein
MAEQIDTASNRELPTPTYLRERLRYDPETGKLFWREHPDMPKKWNTRYANAEAFISFDTKGYKFGSIGRRPLRAHRVIWAMVHNEWPEQIDHINRVRDCNVIENLRGCSRSENARNFPLSKRNKSGVVGVYWRWNRWGAQIKQQGKTMHLGLFLTFEEAVVARKAAERELGFHPNHGSKPLDWIAKREGKNNA